MCASVCVCLCKNMQMRERFVHVLQAGARYAWDRTALQSHSRILPVLAVHHTRN